MNGCWGWSNAFIGSVDSFVYGGKFLFKAPVCEILWQQPQLTNAVNVAILRNGLVDVFTIKECKVVLFYIFF